MSVMRLVEAVSVNLALQAMIGTDVFLANPYRNLWQ